MINVIATIEVNPGCRDEFLKIFKDNVPAVLAEDGCISYSPTIDADTGIPIQTQNGPNKVIVVEVWESIDHLHAHLKAPHMDAYREKVKDMVKGVELTVTQPA